MVLHFNHICGGLEIVSVLCTLQMDKRPCSGLKILPVVNSSGENNLSAPLLSALTQHLLQLVAALAV